MNIEVFISFKNTEDGAVTEDAGIASSIYSMLAEKRIPAFYSNRSLLEFGDTRFKESIIEALSNASILILVASKKQFINSKWVKFEWDSFHSLMLSDDRNRFIIPYISSDIDQHDLPMQLREFETFNFSSFPVENLVSYVEQTLTRIKSKAEILANYETFSSSFSASRCESIYSSSYGNEFERLKIQAQNTREIDLKHLEHIYKNTDREGLVVLDVGSSYGFVADSRFGSDPRIKKVICIDQDEVTVAKGKELHQNEKIRFYCHSASHGSPEALRSILAENGIDHVDIIFVSMVSHHWQRPERVFRELRKILRNKGFIYIRTCDDGAILSYPDPNDMIDQVIRRSSRVIGSSDRYHARKITNQLSRSGYSNISMFSDARSTLGMDIDSRMRFFTEKFGFRLDYFKKTFEKDRSDPVAFSDYQWMAEAIDYVEDMFSDPNFWYCESEFVCIAQKA